MAIKKSSLSLFISALGFAFFFLTARAIPEPKSSLNEKPTSRERLLVFTQEQDEHFLNNSFPALKAWAEKEKIELQQMDTELGVPADITATPALVFINDRGRSVYASRYAELGTIKNFVRTSRLGNQNLVPLCMDNVMRWQKGRATLNAPLKLTSLEGEVPENWSASNFQDFAKEALLAGMDQFEQEVQSCISRTDRAFYCDIHPYLAADGQLYLSLELFSMFNCISPVYSSGDQPLRGDFSNYLTLFAEAGRKFQEQILLAINRSTIGDAWSPLPSETIRKSWEELGFPLSETSDEDLTLPVDFKLQQNWHKPQAALPGVPALFFRFMEPLDRYAGEVTDFSGQLSLYPNGSLKAANFVANLSSLTMGMTELDDKVKRKYIYTRRFPEASFVFELSEEGHPLLAGQINRIPIQGAFRFMKQDRPLLLQAEILPRLNQQGEQQLYVHVQFDLNITDDYGITGPDGPEEARKNMIFDLNFLLSPQ